MTKTLHTALAPLLFVGSFCSLGWFEYRLGQPWPYLSCLYTFTIWGYLTYLYYYEYIIFWKNNLFNWTELIKMITTIGSIAASNFYLTELQMYLHELSIVDDTLEALGAPKKYQRLHNWIIRMIIGWIIYIFIDVAIDICVMFFYIDVNFVIIYRTFVEHYPNFINILSALIWGTILGYTSSRFHQLNDRLQVLCTDFFENNAVKRQDKCILVRQRITEVEDCKQYIWILMHVHLQLYFTSRKLNKIFNIQMLLQMLWNFANSILFYIQIYWTLAMENRQMKIWPFNIIWLRPTCFFILHNALFFTLNYICQTVYCKINKTVAILHELSNYNFDEDLDKEILQFILQIKLREVKFGVGQFQFGYNFIHQSYTSALAFLTLISVYNL